jgi:hypothetical protein
VDMLESKTSNQEGSFVFSLLCIDNSLKWKYMARERNILINDLYLLDWRTNDLHTVESFGFNSFRNWMSWEKFQFTV